MGIVAELTPSKFSTKLTASSDAGLGCGDAGLHFVGQNSSSVSVSHLAYSPCCTRLDGLPGQCSPILDTTLMAHLHCWLLGHGTYLVSCFFSYSVYNLCFIVLGRWIFVAFDVGSSTADALFVWTLDQLSYCALGRHLVLFFLSFRTFPSSSSSPTSTLITPLLSSSIHLQSTPPFSHSTP